MRFVKDELWDAVKPLGPAVAGYQSQHLPALETVEVFLQQAAKAAALAAKRLAGSSADLRWGKCHPIGTAACKGELGRHLQPYGAERAAKPEGRYEGQGKSPSSVHWGRVEGTGTQHQH